MPDLTIDDRGFVRIDGQVLGRGFVSPDGRPLLQVKDKNPARCAERGSAFMVVDIYQIAAVVQASGVKVK